MTSRAYGAQELLFCFAKQKKKGASAAGAGSQVGNGTHKVPLRGFN
jgi:hypothetical protein